jgi:dethiobiotin synthetase
MNIACLNQHKHFFKICQNNPHIFVAGTDTNVGKTIASAWLCMQLQAHYFKPIQSGVALEKPYTDSDFIRDFMHKQKQQHLRVFTEIYCFEHAVSPHLAAQYANQNIEIERIEIPKVGNLIIEGAGGVYVPINKHQYIIDLIHYLNIPVIVAARSCLGTINHTLLTIKALRDYKITILGIILIGEQNMHNKQAIEQYSNLNVLAELNFDACKL